MKLAEEKDWIYYSYLWLRGKDGTFPAGTPYYAGKGKGDRAFTSIDHNVRCPSGRRNIIVQFHPTEEEAFEAEIFFIAFYGRVDLGTGCLRNLTDGGEGTANISEITREKLRYWKNKKMPLHVRQKMSASQRRRTVFYWSGKKRSLLTRQRMSASHSGDRNPRGMLNKHHTPEARKRIGIASHLRECKPSTRQLLREINTGRHPSEITLQKMANNARGNDYHLGYHNSAESKERSRQAHLGQVAWNKGKITSIETRVRQSAAAKRRRVRENAEKQCKQQFLQKFYSGMVV